MAEDACGDLEIRGAGSLMCRTAWMLSAVGSIYSQYVERSVPRWEGMLILMDHGRRISCREQARGGVLAQSSAAASRWP